MHSVINQANINCLQYCTTANVCRLPASSKQHNTTGAAICTATHSNRMQTKLVLAVICLMLGAALASPIDRSSTGEQEQARSSNEVMQEKFNTDKTQEKAEAPQIMVREKQRNKRSTGRGD